MYIRKLRIQYIPATRTRQINPTKPDKIRTIFAYRITRLLVRGYSENILLTYLDWEFSVLKPQRVSNIRRLRTPKNN